EVVDPGVTEADIEKVFAYFRAVDATFSTYKEHSEISKINRGELCEEEYSDTSNFYEWFRKVRTVV
ncbi:MAG TPA: hypothetical protein VE843_07175, partial [Ktedonobacteraceae bacterium]|nr:hypothetical protein [Ktedonobacteraceae bacterium]